ncbi:MAG: YvrJ family protein [Methylocystaceae bacterium]
MTAETLLTYAGNLGFPALLAIYLLVRFEAKLDNLTRSIELLPQAIKIALEQDSTPHSP